MLLKYILIGLAICAVIIVLSGIVLFSIVFSKSKVGEKEINYYLDKMDSKYSNSIRKGIDLINQLPKEEIEIKSYDNIKLKGYLVKGKTEKIDKIIICAHGYHSCYQYDFSLGAIDYYNRGYSLLFIDERACQESGGHFTTFGIKERYDLLEWIKYIDKRFNKQVKILLTGISMGSTTVLFTLGFDLPESVVGAICDCGFTRPSDVVKYTVKRIIPIFSFLIMFAMNIGSIICIHKSLRHPFTKDTLAKNKLPILIIHGTKDNVVPVEMGRSNKDYCLGKADYVEFPDAKHGTSYLVDTKKYQEAVTEYLNKINY